MPDPIPPMAASCEHYWASHVKGGFGLCVRICQLCRTVDWDDLLGELRRVYGAGPTNARSRRLHWGQSVARNASRFGAENTIPVFDGDDHIGDIELSDANAAVLGAMLMDAATDDNGNVITVDIAVDTSGFTPQPVELPRLVDDCNSEMYDKAKARLAYLEDLRVRQQQEVGRLVGQVDDRDQTIARVRELHTRQAVHEAADRCLCPDRDEDTHPVDESDIGAYICERTPIGAVCMYCLMPDSETADSIDGEHVNWPCPTIAALNGPTQEQTP